MSQYNKTVLTHAGLELAKRANAGQAKFGITRAVTSADDWSNKTVQDLEEVTTIPNIMQQGIIMDTDEVESNNSVIGVSLCFTNKKLSTGYQIRIIGLYVKEEGQENDFLYAVTTAITPESMPSFADKVLYKFNIQMYLVIGKAQAVNVVINEGTAVTSTQFNKYKGEVADNLKKLENTHKEDMSHVAKSASINGGAEILPDSTGKLNLVVPDPDLSKYVSLEQLGELLKTKADAVDVNKQIKAVTDLANTKANSSDLTALDKKAVKSVGIYPNNLHFDSGSFNYWSGEVKASPDANGYALIDLTDDTSVRAAADQLNVMLTGLNHLQGKQTKDSADANALSETGVYYCSSPAKNFPVSQWGTLVTSNGNGARASQLYFPDDNSAVWFRTLDDGDWSGWVRLANIDDVNNAINKFDLSKVKFRKQFLNSDGSKVDKTWSATKNDDGTYTIDLYNDDWTAAKLHDVIAQLPNKANASDVYTKSEVDSKTSGNVVTAYDVASKNPTAVRDGYTNRSLVDQLALGQFADAINDINGAWNRYTHHDGFDLLTLWGKFGIHYCLNNNMTNVPDWFADKRGTAFVFTFDNNSQTMIYAGCVGDGFAYYNRLEGKWHKLATDNDITDLQNQIQQLRDNQFEVQTFTDANAAANWEAQRPGKRMAIVNS